MHRNRRQWTPRASAARRQGPEPRFGATLREWRQRQHFTQEQLAERAGLSYKFIGEIERGFGNPTLDTIVSLADALGLGIPDLFIGFRRDRAAADLEYRMSKRDMQMVREAAASLDALVEHLSSPPYKIKRRKKKP